MDTGNPMGVFTSASMSCNIVAAPDSRTPIPLRVHQTSVLHERHCHARHAPPFHEVAQSAVIRLLTRKCTAAPRLRQAVIGQYDVVQALASDDVTFDVHRTGRMATGQVTDV